LTEVTSHGNNVRGVIIGCVSSGDAQTKIQTNGCGKCKTILGPASCTLYMWLAGKKSWPLSIVIHSSALLAAILSSLAAL